METAGKILMAIRDMGPIGQVGLAEALGVERSTISRAVSSLTCHGYVRPCGELPAARSGGRKTVLLELDPNGATALGVELNIRRTVVAHIDLGGNILWKRELETPVAGTPEAILPFLEKAIATALKATGAAAKRFAGIGVGIPGHVDAEQGMALSAVNFDPSWRHVQIRSPLQDRFPYPITIDSDGRMLALAEQWYGKGRGVSDFCIFNVDFGLGMAAVIDDKYFRGANGHACDIHMVVDPNGPVCRCGRQGCIEAIVGQRALNDGSDPEQISHAAKMLGITIANLVDVFDPTRVIITGRILEDSPDFLITVDEAYHKNAIDTRSTPEPDLVRSRFGEDGHVVGAGLAIIQQQLEME